MARYTGQETRGEKDQLQAHPPHLLLTNYMMLELMLTRPGESVFIEKPKADLQFLVLDELHTYRGRQGADVALLVRRLRERSGNPHIRCIGTSATMATGGTSSERRAATAAFAGQLFGAEIEPDDDDEETLRRIIPDSVPTDPDSLKKALSDPIPVAHWSVFAGSPLSAWAERTYGTVPESDGTRFGEPRRSR